MTVASAPVRVGIVGLGEALADPLRSGLASMAAEGRIRVTAGSDPEPGARAAAVDAFGLDGPASSGDAVVAADVDVVLLLGRGDDRPRLAIAALERGRDVVADGPVAPTLEAASRMGEAARASGRTLLCGPFLLDGTFRRVSALVAGGAIGSVLSARAAVAPSRAADAIGDAGTGTARERVADACGPAIAALARLIGPVQAVTAIGRVDPDLSAADGPGAPAPMSLQIGLDFGRGVLGVLTVLPPGSASRTAALEVFGSEGTIQVDGRPGGDGGFDLWLNAVGAWELVAGDGVPADSAAAALGSLVDGTLRGIASQDDLTVAMDVLEVAELATAAAADGRARTTTAVARRSSAAGIRQ